jgi:hypothetical protein
MAVVVVVLVVVEMLGVMISVMSVLAMVVAVQTAQRKYLLWPPLKSLPVFFRAGGLMM